MEIINIDINKLKPYKNNPRKNDEAVEYVANSIKEFGFKVPIIVDKDYEIIAGHTRLKAAQQLGLKEVPIIIADDLTEEQVKAFRLADNKVSEAATWNFELLDNELSNILDIDMGSFGFYMFEEEEEQEIIEDDYEIEVPKEPKAKLGDIYQLGNHRLMCGDGTSEEDVAKLMNGVKADMVFTDPPYGMKKEKDGVLNDNLNYDDLLEFNKKWIPITFNNLKNNGSWYCWGMDEPLMDIYSNILKPMQKQNKITFRNLITWNKSYLKNGNTFNPFGASGSDNLRSYPTADEKCLFVMCGVQGFNNNSDNYFEGYEPIRKYLEEEATKVNLDGKKLKEICGVGMYSHWFTKSQWDLMKEEYYLKLQNYYKNQAFKKEYQAFKKEYQEIKKEHQEIKKEWYETRAYFTNADKSNNVWNIEITKGQEKENAGGHATPKPIELCSRAIKSSSRENENVLDVFGGSGSTLIACEQNNRNAYLMELEPKWVDVIINRWETFTGQKAVLIERKENE